MMHHANLAPSITFFTDLHHLRHAEGRAAALGRDEQGHVQLSWVDVVPRLLAQPDLVAQVEQEAKRLWQGGIRHIIWSGMGGSVTTVKMLVQMGICAEAQGIRLYPLDSTDPAALTAIVEALAAAKGIVLPELGTQIESAWIRWLLEDVMLIGVSMSKTSEEPLSHLAWFLDLLDQAYLDPQDHVRVMTIKGSVLEQLAHEHDLLILPLFLDERPLVGRMSAPGSRIFLLPVALHFVNASERGQLATILRQAWQWHDLDGAEAHPETHPFVQLAAALHQASTNDICRMMLTLPDGWQPLFPWIEQLMEQSLGKQGKGVVVFSDQALNPSAPGYRAEQMLHVSVVPSRQGQRVQHGFQLVQPYLDENTGSIARLAAIAATCLGWQLTMALYAVLADIPFSTEPAVERYKVLARDLRTSHRLDVLASIRDEERSRESTPGRMVLASTDGQAVRKATPAALFAEVLHAAMEDGQLLYLDLTMNGELSLQVSQLVASYLRDIGNTLLGVPVKVRSAPSAYHISEQSELDGPSALVSLRVLMRDQPEALLGTYRARFLHAQAVATWRAMRERGRPCLLLLVDTGSVAAALEDFFTQVEEHLAAVYAKEKRSW